MSKSAFNQISKALYAAARLTRDANAIARGPAAIGKRAVRKTAYRSAAGPFARLLNRLLK